MTFDELRHIGQTHIRKNFIGEDLLSAVSSFLFVERVIYPIKQKSPKSISPVQGSFCEMILGMVISGEPLEITTRNRAKAGMAYNSQYCLQWIDRMSTLGFWDVEPERDALVRLINTGPLEREIKAILKLFLTLQLEIGRL